MERRFTKHLLVQRAFGDGALRGEGVQVDARVRRRERAQVGGRGHTRKETPVATIECRGDRFASSRVNEPERLRFPAFVFSGRLGTSLELKRTWPVCSRNRRPGTRGPPVVPRPELIDPKLKNRPRLFRRLARGGSVGSAQRSPAPGLDREKRRTKTGRNRRCTDSAAPSPT